MMYVITIFMIFGSIPGSLGAAPTSSGSAPVRNREDDDEQKLQPLPCSQHPSFLADGNLLMDISEHMSGDDMMEMLTSQYLWKPPMLPFMEFMSLSMEERLNRFYWRPNASCLKPQANMFKIEIPGHGPIILIGCPHYRGRRDYAKLVTKYLLKKRVKQAYYEVGFTEMTRVDDGRIFPKQSDSLEQQSAIYLQDMGVAVMQLDDADRIQASYESAAYAHTISQERLADTLRELRKRIAAKELMPFTDVRKILNCLMRSQGYGTGDHHLKENVAEIMWRQKYGSLSWVLKHASRVANPRYGLQDVYNQTLVQRNHRWMQKLGLQDLGGNARSMNRVVDRHARTRREPIAILVGNHHLWGSQGLVQHFINLGGRIKAIPMPDCDPISEHESNSLNNYCHNVVTKLTIFNKVNDILTQLESRVESDVPIKARVRARWNDLALDFEYYQMYLRIDSFPGMDDK